MGKITQLSKEISVLIAAGEVVERPASAVKELVENAIDAGATRISVELLNGGMDLIRVSDNGEGMDEPDAKLAFSRHATSKISSEDDLFNIKTMGFRGEALAAIASVSRVILLTRRRGAIEGTHISLEAGVLKECAPAGCPDGTTIAVKDLFFNTPARLKYLKRNASEAANCESAVERMALAYPEISFRMLNDGAEVIHTAGDGKLAGAIYTVLGRDFHKGLIEVDVKSDGVRIYGFISPPSNMRGNRRMQYCFVNRRSVRSFTVINACEEAYKGLAASGRFPACVLNVSVDFSQVDVNVHPAKTEIKFASDRRIFDAVYFALKAALEGDTVRFTELEQHAPPVSVPSAMHYGAVERGMQAVSRDNPFEKIASNEFTGSAFESAAPSFFGRLGHSSDSEPVQESIENMEKTPVSAPAPQARLIGELFRLYILAEYGESLIVVDKHAAHEKRIYNLLRAEKKGLSSQMLLVPAVIRLDRGQKSVVLDNSEVFAELGFEIEDFGEGSLIVRSIPAVSREEDIQGILEEAGEALAASRKGGFSFLDRLLFSVACKAAVRAGDRNSPEELTAVLSAVLTSDEIRNCPHGRPVMAVFTRREIEKWFSR